MTDHEHKHIAQRADPYAQNVSHAIDLMRGKWTLQILCATREKPVRLGELKRLFPAASKKSLVGSLRILEAENLVLRKELSGKLCTLNIIWQPGRAIHSYLLLDHLAEWKRSRRSQVLEGQFPHPIPDAGKYDLPRKVVASDRWALAFNLSVAIQIDSMRAMEFLYFFARAL